MHKKSLFCTKSIFCQKVSFCKLKNTLPTVKLSNSVNDKKVFGAFTSLTPLSEDHWYYNKTKVTDRFAVVNALGEGRVLVTNINEKYISYVGFPVKKMFFEPCNQRAIKKEFQISENKPVVLLLMGAQGSQDLYKFTKQLSTLSIPAHIVIVLGRSEDLRKSLENIPFPSHITKTIIGFMQTAGIPIITTIQNKN